MSLALALTVAVTAGSNVSPDGGALNSAMPAFGASLNGNAVDTATISSAMPAFASTLNGNTLDTATANSAMPAFGTSLNSSYLPLYESWRSDNGLAVTGSNVNSWTGLVNSYVLSYGTGTQPTKVASDLNGFPSIAFGGGPLTQTAEHALSNPCTYAIVGKMTSVHANGAQDCLLDSLHANFNMALLTDTTPETYSYTQGVLAESPAAVLATANWWIVLVVCNGGASASSITVYTHGGSTVVTAGNQGSVLANGFVLGSTLPGTRGALYHCVELDAWTGAASANDQTAILNYLKTRYAI